MRRINLISLAVGIAGFLFFAYVLGSEEGVVLWAVAVTAARAIASEWMVSRRLGLDFRKRELLEFLISVVFVVIAINIKF